MLNICMPPAHQPEAVKAASRGEGAAEGCLPFRIMNTHCRGALFETVAQECNAFHMHVTYHAQFSIQRDTARCSATIFNPSLLL